MEGMTCRQARLFHKQSDYQGQVTARPRLMGDDWIGGYIVALSVDYLCAQSIGVLFNAEDRDVLSEEEEQCQTVQVETRLVTLGYRSRLRENWYSSRTALESSLRLN